MKIMIALAIGLLSMAAESKTLATYERDGLTYTIESTGTHTEVVCHDGEIEVCPNENYKVPQWLIDLNQWFLDRGFTAPTEQCGGDGNVCPNENYKVPQWLIDLNQWFLDHGFTAPPEQDYYMGG